MKIIAIASAGGHWIQLQRIMPAFQNTEVVFVSTKSSFRDLVPENKFYSVRDFNRNNKGFIIPVLFQLFQIIIIERPHCIITTGAAPGLIALVLGKLLFRKTIWLDSIANVKELSMSGRIAAHFADRVYTQWPSLATKKVIYAGNVLS